MHKILITQRLIPVIKKIRRDQQIQGIKLGIKKDDKLYDKNMHLKMIVVYKMTHCISTKPVYFMFYLYK